MIASPTSSTDKGQGLFLVSFNYALQVCAKIWIMHCYRPSIFCDASFGPFFGASYVEDDQVTIESRRISFGGTHPERLRENNRSCDN